MKLSSRLKTVYDMVPKGIAYDVGSDHGKLIISLIENNKINFGYAGENKIGPYNRLKSEIDKSSKKANIKALLNDGINDLPKDVNILLICGMGGTLINDILNKNKQNLIKVEHIIVDAHNAIKDVRVNLINLGYKIYEEKIILEKDIFYEIIHFIKGQSEDLNELEIEYGPILLKDKSKTFIDKWNKRLEEINYLLSFVNNEVRREQLILEAERIKQIL